MRHLARVTHANQDAPMKRLVSLLVAAAGLLAVTMPAFAADPIDTIKTIKDRGHLLCGQSQGVAGFSAQGADGKWKGFDTDICRALAAVLFNDPEKVIFLPLSSKDRLTALQSGEIDVLSRTTTWTLSRNSNQGLTFTAINYYDGQGFVVRKKLGVRSVAELAGASICVPQGTTTELNVADYFNARKLKYDIVTFATPDEALKAYESGRCDAYTTDVSSLISEKNKFATPDDHEILPELISKEPLGPWVRVGDERWFNLVRWTLFAMVGAEELGVTSANVQQQLTSDNPEVKRMLGVTGAFGESLGVSNDWVVRIIKAVGNYGESFDRNLGEGSPIKLQRGANKLWSNGGLQYSPPFR
jgi:general L-amino acid transport system substrate-binding protein